MAAHMAVARQSSSARACGWNSSGWGLAGLVGVLVPDR